MAQPLGLEITELRLGLPGSDDGHKNDKKRVFSEKEYSDLVVALERLFGCFGTGKALKDEYVPIYEDKDGDWMLVGDVPWE
ncbi:hypothetical protein D5086_006371 [Populus alba]|uniref:Uncharacterized protein n=1 Tax=Populus alba TaxID=43335 RepID=A0ACC4CKI8_POPAL